MKFRIYNTKDYLSNDTLNTDYFNIVTEHFGEVKTRKVYRDLNTDSYEIEYYVEVKSLEQLVEFTNKINIAIIIDRKDDRYVYFQEVDKYVLLKNNKNPQILSIEIYDGYRE